MLTHSLLRPFNISNGISLFFIKKELFMFANIHFFLFICKAITCKNNIYEDKANSNDY